MAEELSTLLSLAQKQGISQDELISKIKSAIAKEYQIRYPNGSKDITVLVDIHAKQIRLLAENKDVTPPGFTAEAIKIAEKIIIANMKPKKEKPVEPDTGSMTELLIKFLFYGYNLISLFYLGIFILGLLSQSFRDFLIKIFEIKGTFGLLTISILLATPLISLYLGLKQKLLKKPTHLAQFFFLFELPTVILSLFLFSAFTKPIPAVWLFSLFLLILPLVIFLKASGAKAAGIYKSIASLVTKEIVFLSSIYISLLYSFFFPIIIGTIAHGVFEILKDFFQYNLERADVGDFIGMLIFLPFGVVGLLIVTALSFLPYIITYITTKMFLEENKEQQKQIGKKRTTNTILSTALVFLILILAASYQANINPFLDKLDALGKANTFEQREDIARELIPHENTIKQAIKDARNAHRRYLFVKNDDFLSSAYENIFSMPKTAAQYLQDSFSVLAYPFVYRGATDKNGKLSQAYENLFGRSLYQEYYPRKSFETKDVRLLSRKTGVQTDYQGLLATVSVEEEYENKTFAMQEVIYEFFLPSEAVVTDLRLGPNLEYEGVIAPRGAAQKVYEQELRKRRDPALLEQVGPRQYRLRVFPIPGKDDASTLNGKNQRVKFSYVVGATNQGYPLPVYTRERNVVIDKYSEIAYYLNGSEIRKANVDTVVRNPKTGGPDNDPCTFSQILAGKSNLQTLSLKLTPHKAQDMIGSDYSCGKNGNPSLLTNTRDKRIAILYDVSYQNKNSDFPLQLKNLLAANKNFLSKNLVDLYLFNDKLSSPRRLNQNTMNEILDAVYFGKSDLEKILTSFSGLYDLAVIVTYADENSVFNFKNQSYTRLPIYVLHTKGIIPPYSNEFTDYVLQSGGQVVDSIPEAINHYVITQMLRQRSEKLLFVGPYWSIVGGPKVLASIFHTPTLMPSPFPIKVKEEFTAIPDDPLSYIAGKGYILNELASYTGKIENNKVFLDRLNQLAEQSNVVTPYSSLIALVTQEQREQLEQEKGRYDRYEVKESPTVNIRPPVPFESNDLGLGMPLLGAPAMFKMQALDGGSEFAAPGISEGGSSGAAVLPLLLPLVALSLLLTGGGGLIFSFYFIKRFLQGRS